jgi:hypothetical protein
MASREEALLNVRHRREALRGTLLELQTRLRPPQIAEDLLQYVDGDLSFLGRIQARIKHNKLLALGVLAGIGWLAGGSNGTVRRSGAQQRKAAQTSTRAKEKNDDSGQNIRSEQPGNNRRAEKQVNPADNWPESGNQTRQEESDAFDFDKEEKRHGTRVH